MELVNRSDLNIGDVVSFSIYGNGIVADISEGTIVSFSSGDILRNAAGAAANHANLYPVLPNLDSDPTPNDYTKYQYLVIRTTDGSVVEIGDPWIVSNTISRMVRATARVTIGDFDSSRLPILMEALSVYGFGVPIVEIINP